MKSNKIIFLLLVILLANNAFSQNIQEEDIPQTDSIEKSDVNKSENKSFLDRLDFVLQFEPSFFFTPESKANKSNPVIAQYPVTMGALWPNDFFIAVQPTISFFSMNHVWYEDRALPAEIENRTTTTLSFMINIPAVYTINFKSTENFNSSKLQIIAGPAILLRFGLLANGVNENDSGFSGSAASDVKLINNWFWEKGHWLNISAGASWLYQITKKIQIGPVLNTYIPIGNILDLHSAEGLMLSLGFKMCI